MTTNLALGVFPLNSPLLLENTQPPPVQPGSLVALQTSGLCIHYPNHRGSEKALGHMEVRRPSANLWSFNSTPGARQGPSMVHSESCCDIPSTRERGYARPRLHLGRLEQSGHTREEREGTGSFGFPFQRHCYLVCS